MKRSRTENEPVDAAAPASRGDGKDVKKKRPSVEGKTTRCSTDGNEWGGGAGKSPIVSNIADPWDLVECQKCSSTQDEERMILCDVCDGGYHFYCAEPKLKKVPDGDWICQSCVALKTGKKRRRRRTQAEMLLERASAAAVTSSKGDSGVSCSGVVKGEGAAPDKTEAQETPWDETTCGKCGSAEDEEHTSFLILIYIQLNWLTAYIYSTKLVDGVSA